MWRSQSLIRSQDDVSIVLDAHDEMGSISGGLAFRVSQRVRPNDPTYSPGYMGTM